jgi:hypothetical protein
MSFFLGFLFYGGVTGITALIPGTDDLIGIIRCMVLMAFFTITLDKGGMENGPALFHFIMAVKAESTSLFREKEFVGGRMRRMAVITLPCLGGGVHIYLLKLLRRILMTGITKSRQWLL